MRIFVFIIGRGLAGEITFYKLSALFDGDIKQGMLDRYGWYYVTVGGCES